METFDLSPDELREAQQVINRTRPGLYTLIKLYGREAWGRKADPRTFGKGFKAAVDAKRLIGITRHPDRTSDNATQYHVLGR